MTMPSRSTSALLGPERRFASAAGIELRAEDGESDSIGFRGHAAMFEKRTWIGPPKWGFWEVVRSGAFAKTIRESDVRMLLNHNPSLALARSTIKTGPGSLRLSEDTVGLLSDADWIRTSYSDDLAVTVRTGVLDGMSFSFVPVREEWAVTPEGDDERALIEVNLFDVSPVTFPAYPDTDASLRAIDAELDRASGVPVEERKQLVRSFYGRVTTSDLALALRAALTAPAELEDKRRAPAAATRVEEDLLLIKSEHIRRRMRGLTALAGDTKGQTQP